MLERLTDALGTVGEARPGQHQMTTAIAQAVATERHLVVQAGTGTGKSLAYLAATTALGKTTVIATATKALQDQLADKELPFLVAHGGKPITWAVLKGRSNYLCRQRFDELDDPNQPSLDGMEKISDKELVAIRSWAATTVNGDRAELDIEPRPSTWAAVSVGPRECPGASNCPRGEDCFAEVARAKAASADVIVVNTHLYGLHLASGRMILPPHDVVVFDECHELGEVISATTGMELTAGRFANAAHITSGLIADEGIIEGVESIGLRIEAMMRPMIGERLRNGIPAEIGTLLGIAKTRLSDAMEAARSVDSKVSPEVATRVARVLTALTALSDDLSTLLAPPPGSVLWIESDRDTPRLCLAPLDVGATLDRLLWDPPPTGLDIDDDVPFANRASDDDEPGLPGSVILTSATVPEALAEQLHLPPDLTDVIDVGTPFDFETQGLLYCAAHMPDPREPSYPEAVAEELFRLITAAGGRTLALFTSYRMMQLSADALSDRLPFEVLVQGTRPKPALISAFTEDESSCLFATMGYWQGIDVPGAALSLVTIDRIPFPRPDEPLWQARREAAGPSAFRLIDVPRAATLLAQGAGRLVRHSSDRGVVAILDPRFANNKSYRWSLISALPPFRRTKELSEVERFFALE